MVNPFDEPSILPQLCHSFLKLSDAYASSLRTMQVENPRDMILQIIPVDFIASRETLIIPKPAANKRLAFEVYDRCAPQFDETRASPFSCACALQLAKTIPRNIPLKLISKANDGSPLADRCIHVGYCYPLHSQWLTAAWTDNYGCLQWNASYHLATQDSEEWPTFAEVAKDILGTTMDIARLHSNPYRCLLVREGNLPKEELDGKPEPARQRVHHAANNAKNGLDCQINVN